VQARRKHTRNDRLIKNLSEGLKSGDYLENLRASVGSGTQIFKKCRSQFKILGARKET
jgi:hypothetical protein